MRSLDSQETLNLEVPNTCTVQELKESLCFRLSNGGSSSSNSPDKSSLTLNGGSDELSDSSVQSVAVTPIDLLCYSLNPNPDESSAHTANLESQIDDVETLCANNAQTLELVTSGEVDGFENMEVDDDIDDCDVAYLRSMSVSSFLKKVFDGKIGNSSTSNGSDHTLVEVAVHAVLLESGFIGYDPVSSTKIDVFKSGGSPLHYTTLQVLSSSGVQSVAINLKRLGKFVDLSGSLTNKGLIIHREILNVSLLAPAFNLVWKNMKIGGDLMLKKAERVVVEFWKHVKDGFALPLLTDLCKTAGFVPPSHLLILPTNVMLKILEPCNGTEIAVVACVCAELRLICSDDRLWRCKYEEEFGMGKMDNTGCSWKLRYSNVRLSDLRRRRFDDYMMRRRQPLRWKPVTKHSFPFGVPNTIGLGEDYDDDDGDIVPYPLGRRLARMHPNGNLHLIRR